MFTRRVLQFLFALMVVMALADNARAAYGYSPDGDGPLNSAPPVEYVNVGIDQNLGQQLPLDATFTDENGKSVTLGDYFADGKPVILQLGYFGCPNLCDYVSRGTLATLKDIDLKLGSDFKLVYISFNPHETWHDGALKKEGYIRELNQEGAGAGWHFLVGQPPAIDAVTKVVGFHYKWVDQAKQFSHAAAIFVVTPQGKLSRYLFGTTFPAQTLRLSLVEASNNKIGTAMDQVLLYCFHYDVHTGKYTLAAVNLMRAAGVFTVLVLVCTLVPRHIREAKRKNSNNQP